MNRIDDIFAALRREKRKALMPFLTAGDPDLATTAALLPVLQKCGASIVELGFPFSDPIADGPVIQASMAHALSQGLRAEQVLEMAASRRGALSLGLVAMVSYSIVHRLGVASFVARARRCGIDGLIVPDVVIEESAGLRGAAADAGLTCSFLISPTTPEERAAAIARACSGFVYVLARAGLTGERRELPTDLTPRIERLRRATPLPIAVGFGVSNAQQVAEVVSVADAAIVGSAIMRRVAQVRDQGSDVVVSQVGAMVSELAGGLALGRSGPPSGCFEPPMNTDERR